MTEAASRALRWRMWYRRIFPAYAIFLLCATHFPRLELTRMPGDDKTAHFVAYAILAFLFWRFVQTFDEVLTPRFAPLGALTLFAWAALDEWTQPIMGRSADVIDFAVDCLGIAFVIALLEAGRRLSAKRSAAQNRGTG